MGNDKLLMLLQSAGPNTIKLGTDPFLTAVASTVAEAASGITAGAVRGAKGHGFFVDHDFAPFLPFLLGLEGGMIANHFFASSGVTSSR